MTEVDIDTDEAQQVGAFAEWLSGAYTSAMVTLMVDLGHRVGLFEAAADGAPLTSEALARRAGCDERYVREWLGAMVTAGIFEYDASGTTYRLPAAHATCLAGATAMNLAASAAMIAHLGKYVVEVGDAFVNGGGVPYSRFRPEFTGLMDLENRARYDAALVDTYLPLAPGLVKRLRAGARAADVGCGTGHCVNIMAAAFPASRFMGYDLAEDAIDRARAEGDAMGLSNAQFEVADVAALAPEPGFDVVFAFDAVHDQVDPAGVLAAVRRAVGPDGMFFMVDIKAHSALEDNVGNPFAPLLYGISVLHCMTVSLAGGGVGLGTVWGEETALRMLSDAGFSSVVVFGVEADPFNSVYVCSA